MLKKEYQNKLQEVSILPYSSMKPEWNDQETKKVDRAIRSLFSMQTLENHRGEKHKMYTMNNIENFFGLPYTSSSSFAMLGITNTRFSFDTENEFGIDCFALGNDSNVYVWCSDREENEKLYKIL